MDPQLDGVLCGESEEDLKMMKRHLDEAGKRSGVKVNIDKRKTSERFGVWGQCGWESIAAYV